MVVRERVERAVVAVVLVSIPLLVFYRCLFGGQAFVPGDLLGYVAPWSHSSSSALHPWNVLRFDGITQFYPWRLESARSIRAGRIPLWNSYEFSASGGTPFLADSQSAPLYPINFVYDLFSPRWIWFAFGLVAALQLEIATCGLYIFLARCVKVSRVPALLGAVTFALSGPVTTWLALPTFLSVCCWIPWLMVTIHAAHAGSGRLRILGRVLPAGVVAGLMILAGHLQIALYGVLLGFAYSVYLQYTGRRETIPARDTFLYLAAITVVAVIAIALASPQVLPSIELSRISHRAASGFPTWDGYKSFILNALPLRNFVTFLFPNFFGHPNSHTALYWNTNNYAEWALYVGVAPLVLSFFAIGLPWRKESIAAARVPALQVRSFFCAVAAVSLLLAMGTPANIPFFFLLPGYSQTGNPGRILVIFAFALAVLGAVGLEAFLSSATSKAGRERATVVAVGAPALLAAIGAGQAAAFQRTALPGTSLGTLLSPIMPSVYIGILLLVLVGLPLLFRSSGFASRIAPVLVALSFADLIAWGWGYNPTATPEEVYPLTPGIAFLQTHAAPDDLIAPINRHWNLGSEGPQGAVLPPNSLTVFGLHDVGGYDSLFRRSAKDQMRDAGDGADPSPPENGNMLFVKDAETAVRLGARFVVFAPDDPYILMSPSTRVVYEGYDLRIYENTTTVRPFDGSVGGNYQPASFRTGLFMALMALAIIAASILSALSARVIVTLRPPQRQHHRVS